LTRANASELEPNRGLARVSLETLRLAEGQIAQDPSFVKAKAKLENLAYPALRVRIAVGELANCPPTLTKENLRTAILCALAPVARASEETWDLTLSITSVSCASTEIPREAVERVNSTYVAGHNQLANPQYVKLQDQLNYAQQQLNRSEIEAQVNPNFGTGFAKGMWQGKVVQLQRALAATPPYITQEVVQQYQYDKFEAYRSYQIEGNLRVYSKAGQAQFASEKKASFVAEDRKEGISGVLPEDRTDARNVEPVLIPMAQCAVQASAGFERSVGLASKELVAGYFASSALSKQVSSRDRLGALLYVFDLADATQYEKSKLKLASTLSTALVSELNGVNFIESFVESLPLPLPERVEMSESDVAASEVSTTTLEQVLQGAVSVETDAGKAGSGFFLTAGCLVVTNEHVVGNAETIVLRTASRKLFTASVLAKDDKRDLALLRTNARSCTPLQLGNPDHAAVGEEIYAIGDPLGLSGTVTRGIISAFRTARNGVHYIQLDATVNPGNSGGPVVSRSGLVLGVTRFKMEGYEGLNFAVASSEIKSAFGRFLP
jgi:S1-C subfamily serine protease/uncharacterized membrane protein YfbV (UPF0208 family)